MQDPKLHRVYSVTALPEEGALLVHVDITDMEGQRMRVHYPSREGDPFGLNPIIREWLAKNDGNFTIKPYEPPTLTDIRRSMPAITRRQLRLALVRGGISLGSVDSAIAAMPNGTAKDEARIEWEDAATFDRLHPTLLLVAGALGLNAEQVDALWETALTI